MKASMTYISLMHYLDLTFLPSVSLPLLPAKFIRPHMNHHFIIISQLVFIWFQYIRGKQFCLKIFSLQTKTLWINKCWLPHVCLSMIYIFICRVCDILQLFMSNILWESTHIPHMAFLSENSLLVPPVLMILPVLASLSLHVSLLLRHLQPLNPQNLNIYKL